MDTKNIVLHLSLISEIGSGTINTLIKHLGQDNLQDVYNFSQQDFIRFGMSEKRAELLVQGLCDQSLLEKELVEIERYQASFVTVLCTAYPELLKQIEVPPAVLYYQGDVSLFKQGKMLACVGARKAHGYVQDCLTSVVIPLIQDGWVIVSGGALGADTYAHKAALQNNGKTIVVVGSGLCHQYPPKNKALFQKVIESGGLVISSFPMNMQPEARCFPMRNRIIAGLSAGCLVLQAASKSGALITAQFALEQGREVFAVPGPIYDPLSAGCHDLIKQGAKLVASPQDIVDELIGFGDRGKNYQQDIPFEQPVELQDPIDQQILQHTIIPVTMQDLMVKVEVEQGVLHEKLFSLSLDGKIEQDCMGLWKRL